MTPAEIIEMRKQEVLRMRANLEKEANLRNLVLEDLESQKNLVNGIKKVSITQIIDQAQQLQNIILPSLEKKYGLTHDQYIYWKGVLDSLNWLLYVLENTERLERKLIQVRHQLMYYKELTAKLEKELDHYTSMENFMMKELIQKALKND